MIEVIVMIVLIVAIVVVTRVVIIVLVIIVLTAIIVGILVTITIIKITMVIVMATTAPWRTARLLVLVQLASTPGPHCSVIPTWSLTGDTDMVSGWVAIVGGRPSVSPVFDAAVWLLTRRG